MTRRIVIINPNATAAMTTEMVEIGQSFAPPDVEIVGMTNAAGPAAIQGAADAAACLPGLFALTQAPSVAEAAALIIGCFDDTGLEEIRARMRCPVIGLGEAGLLAATLAASRFAVLTTTDGSVPVIQANIGQMSLASRCDAVKAAGVPVLDLADRMQDLKSALRSLSTETGTGAIVLGCAGMGRIAGQLAEVGLPPLVDPVRAAVTLALSVIASSVRAEAPLPMFAELLLEGAAADAPAAMEAMSGVEIVVGDVVIRAGADTDEGLLTRAIRAARASTA